MKRILVVTLTCGRLDVSKKYVPMLAEKAGCDYDHIIVDNGSTDGTPQWFQDHGYEVIRNTNNMGVATGWEIGYLAGKKYNPDYVIRMDDDCDIESDNILAEMMRFYGEHGDSYVTSPMNVPLLQQPKYMPKTVDPRKKLGGWNVNFTTHSGLFVCVPTVGFQMMVEKGMREGDNRRGSFWRNNGFPTVYLNDLKVHHEGRGTSTYGKYVY